MQNVGSAKEMIYLKSPRFFLKVAGLALNFQNFAPLLSPSSGYFWDYSQIQGSEKEYP